MKLHYFIAALSLLTTFIKAGSVEHHNIKITCTDLSQFPKKYLVAEPCNVTIDRFVKNDCFPIKVTIENGSDQELVFDPLLNNRDFLPTEQVSKTFTFEDVNTTNATLSILIHEIIALAGPVALTVYKDNPAFLFGYGITIPLFCAHVSRVFQKKQAELRDNFKNNLQKLNLIDLNTIAPGETVTKVAFIPRVVYDQAAFTLYFRQPYIIIYFDCPFRE